MGAALASGFVAGCASQTEYPRELYVQRHFIEAEDLFDHMEGDLAQLSVAERAEYGLYRGMTLLSLGDFSRAQHWLSYATTLERQQPRVLTASHNALLQQGWLRIEAERARLARAAAASPETTTQATLPPQATPPPPNEPETTPAVP